MPLRISYPPAAAFTRLAPLPLPLPRIPLAHPPRRLSVPPWLRIRTFHAGPGPLRRGHLESKNHYQRLNLEPTATHGDVKKSFYSLSKIHHPDANPSDPHAASTFSLLSESYTILSDPSRRAAYDRDVLHLHHQQSPSHAHHASYHSTNPAGGRAPSGLSRRRGTFRGPPPSFYRSGGYGANAEKRRRAHDESTASSSSTASETRAGMGPGADPFHFRFHQHFEQAQQHQYEQDAAPHFDKAGHTRTHQREDVRRWRRAKTALGDDGLEFEPQTSLVGHFFIVAGILAATFLAPVVYLQFMRLGGRKKEEE